MHHPRIRRRPPGRWAAAGILTAALLLAGALQAQPTRPAPGTVRPGPRIVRPPVQEQVRPLDPLTERERAAAIRLVRDDERIRGLVARREWDIGYVELLVVKTARPAADTPERPAVASRRAEVLIALFDDEFQGLRAVVDLDSGFVREVERQGPPARAGEGRERGGFRVPFTPRERELARGIALQNAEMRSLVGARLEGYQVEGLPITQVIPDLCPSGRCLEMIFYQGDTYLTSTVVVDIPSRASRFRRGPR